MLSFAFKYRPIWAYHIRSLSVRYLLGRILSLWNFTILSDGIKYRRITSIKNRCAGGLGGSSGRGAAGFWKGVNLLTIDT